MENIASKIPSTNPSPTSSRPTKKPKKQLVKASALATIIIIAIVFLTYLMACQALASASKNFKISVGNVEITNTSIFPPYADLRIDCVIENPSELEFNINRIEADIFINSGSTVCPVGEINVTDKPLLANSSITIPVAVHYGANVIDFFSSVPSSCTLEINGTISANGKWSFWTITYQNTLNFNKTLYDLGLDISELFSP